MRRSLSGLGISLVCLLPLSLMADEVSLPHAMAALGDSMTEGMLTDFSIERPPNLAQVVYIIGGASDHDQRFEFFRKHYAKPAHSWAAGNDDTDIVYSHFERLKKLQPQITMQNFAVSGAESKDLSDQVDRLLLSERESGVYFDYVTLMIGANDLGRERVEDFVSPMVYQKNIESQLRRLLDENRDRRILLVGLPPVHDVFEASAPFKAYSVFGKSILCGEMRKMVYGPMALFKPEVSDAYETSKTIFALYQIAVQSAADQLQQDFPTAKIKAVVNYKGGKTSKKTLSVDCFHPSVWGQAELAEVTWRRGFWASVK